MTMTAPKKKVAILGSTGSVGTNTLNVIRQHRALYEVVALSCGSSLDILKQQIDEFLPKFVSVGSEELARAAQTLIGRHTDVKIFWGDEGHRECVELSQPNIVISAMMGTYGLKASLQAVQQGVDTLGIANKEILVMAGTFILEALSKSKTQLVPVDSEHSAIFQALMGNSLGDVKTMILTASGGPFRSRDVSTFGQITKAEALKHPNWSMGAKITIDSATMMNKGLEFIEAVRLFGIDAKKIDIVIHPESIIHSLVEFCDGSFMAQLGISDMKIPISLALAYPNRLPLTLSKKLNLIELKSLTFEAPDYERFPCLRLAREAEALGPEGPVILNASNEVAVEQFLKEEAQFIEIPGIVEGALEAMSGSKIRSLDDALYLDSEVKSWVRDKSSSQYRRTASVREKLTL